jgi:hypothetical protein
MNRLICTIITKSYLAHARALAESIREHNPDLPPLLVLLADRVDGYFDPAREPFQMIQLEDLADQEGIREMSFYYTPFEFCCALRGLLHDYILNHTQSQSWIFLDSDILVLNDLSIVFSQIEEHSIVLNPHLTAPVNPVDIEIAEVNLLHAGLYNAGFLGLHRTDETRAFVGWFRERLRWFCFEDHPHLFVDQAWLNHAPLFFSDVMLLKSPGINLGHWKLRGRIISKHAGNFTVDGTPVLFAHFTGWDPMALERVSKYRPDLDGSICDGWTELSAVYNRRLQRFGYDSAVRLPYAFTAFDDGYPIQRHHRRAYYAALRTQRWLGGPPFASRRSFIAKVYRDRPWWRRLVKQVKEHTIGIRKSDAKF